MPFYEHIFLARQDLAQAQVETMAGEFARIVEEGGGRVVKTEMWGLRTIAYRIAKNRKAHYVMLGLDSPAPPVAELERQVALNEDVIRFLTLRVDALDTEPSAMMRRDRDREGSREGGGRDRDRGEPRGDRDRDRDRGGDRDRGDRAPRAERAPQPVEA